jgi:hypothetical protein
MACIPERKQRGPVEIIEGKGIKIPVYYGPYRARKAISWHITPKRKGSGKEHLPSK